MNLPILQRYVLVGFVLCMMAVIGGSVIKLGLPIISTISISIVSMIIWYITANAALFVIYTRAPDHTITYSFAYPTDTVFDAIKKSLNALNWKIQQEDKVSGKLGAIIGANIRTFKQGISIALTTTDDATTVRLVCGTFQFIDWGGNRRSTERLLHELQALLP